MRHYSQVDTDSVCVNATMHSSPVFLTAATVPCVHASAGSAEEEGVGRVSRNVHVCVVNARLKRLCATVRTRAHAQVCALPCKPVCHHVVLSVVSCGHEGV